MRFKKYTNFDTKRQFPQDYISKVVYWDNKVELHGFVPVKLKVYEDGQTNTELAKIEFCIKDHISVKDRYRLRNGYGSSKPIGMTKYDQLKPTTILEI